MCFIVRCLACGTAMKQLLLCICIYGYYIRLGLYVSIVLDTFVLFMVG
nr:MAG TPA: hypothetical protein [Caudoviricetes sp.]